MSIAEVKNPSILQRDKIREALEQAADNLGVGPLEWPLSTEQIVFLLHEGLLYQVTEGDVPHFAKYVSIPRTAEGVWNIEQAINFIGYLEATEAWRPWPADRLHRAKKSPPRLAREISQCAEANDLQLQDGILNNDFMRAAVKHHSMLFLLQCLRDSKTQGDRNLFYELVVSKAQHFMAEDKHDD